MEKKAAEGRFIRENENEVFAVGKKEISSMKNSVKPVKTEWKASAIDSAKQKKGCQGERARLRKFHTQNTSKEKKNHSYSIQDLWVTHGD